MAQTLVLNVKETQLVFSQGNVMYSDTDHQEDGGTMRGQALKPKINVLLSKPDCA